jgi:hypothetical protein
MPKGLRRLPLRQTIKTNDTYERYNQFCYDYHEFHALRLHRHGNPSPGPRAGPTPSRCNSYSEPGYPSPSQARSACPESLTFAKKINHMNWCCSQIWGSASFFPKPHTFEFLSHHYVSLSLLAACDSIREDSRLFAGNFFAAAVACTRRLKLVQTMHFDASLLACTVPLINCFAFNINNLRRLWIPWYATSTHSIMSDHILNLLKLQALDFHETTSVSESERADLRNSIPQPIIAHYDRLVARGKKGIALVRNQVCTGCHMRLPIGTINTLMQNHDIQLCDSCGRYLYLVEEPAVPAADAAPVAKPAPKPRKRRTPAQATV